MWSERPSAFLVVKVAVRRFRFVFPVPLFVFADLLEALADLAALAAWLVPALRPAGAAAALLPALLAEVRRVPRWTPLEVRDGETFFAVVFF